MVAMQVFKAFLEIRDVFGSALAFEDHLVDVYFHVFSDLAAEDSFHHPLIGGAPIDEVERHEFESVYCSMSDEGGLWDVILVHLDLMISTEGV